MTCRSRWLVPVLAVAVVVAIRAPVARAGACAGTAAVEVKQVAEGVKLTHEQCEDPLFQAWIVEIDLDVAGYELLVTPYKGRNRTTSEFATAHGAIVAVNGGFWSEEWGGFTVSNGQLWPKNNLDLETSTTIGFGGRDTTGRLIVDIRPTEEVLTEPTPGMLQALTANPLIVQDGKPVPVASEHTIFKHRHPRTALGVTKDGGTMILVIVDGRQKEWSLGFKIEALASYMVSKGAWRAANMDGGASSTLVIPGLGGLQNKPCEKNAPERIVSNHLALVPAGVKGKLGALDRLLAPFKLLASLLLA